MRCFAILNERPTKLQSDARSVDVPFRPLSLVLCSPVVNATRLVLANMLHICLSKLENHPKVRLRRVGGADSCVLTRLIQT